MSTVFSRYVFKTPVINQLLDEAEYELTNWAVLVITVIRKPNPIIIFLFHSKYFQLQQNMPTSLYVLPYLHYLILGNLVFWRDVYSGSHFFLYKEMRLWLRSHGTGQIFEQLTNWSRHCPFNIFALFTRNLKTARRLNFVRFLFVSEQNTLTHAFSTCRKFVRSRVNANLREGASGC